MHSQLDGSSSRPFEQSSVESHTAERGTHSFFSSKHANSFSLHLTSLRFPAIFKIKYDPFEHTISQFSYEDV